MEDILASIRKIIDDDEPGAPEASGAEVVDDSASDDDDVLELSEIVDESRDESEEAPLELTEGIEEAEQGGQGGQDHVQVIPLQASSDHGDEASDAMAQAEAEAGDMPAAAAPEGSSGDVSHGLDPHTPENTQSDVVADAVPETETAPSEEDTMSNDGLISDQTRDSAAAALGSLARASERDPLEAVPRGRAIEELVMEQLKPMLSDWLDQHLPSIVERIVEREVRYLSRRLEGDDRT
jgi:uncharacterized protein